MLHVTFALLPDSARAEAATRAIMALQTRDERHVTLIAHRDALELREPHDQDESDSARALGQGALVGSGVGALAGALLAGPFGLLGGVPLVGAVFGAGAGTLHGMLWSSLTGTELPDQTLRELAQGLQEGNVLLTVKTRAKETHDQVLGILREHDARIAEKRHL